MEVAGWRVLGEPGHLEFWNGRFIELALATNCWQSQGDIIMGNRSSTPSSEEEGSSSGMYLSPELQGESFAYVSKNEAAYHIIMSKINYHIFHSSLT